MSEPARFPQDRVCPTHITGRVGAGDGPLRCIYTAGHSRPHRFMAPDATVCWWPVGTEPPAWADAIFTPATDPRWPAEVSP